MAKRQSKADKALDAEISRIFHENCSGIQIPIMETVKIHAEARKAHAEGRDMREAIVAYVETVRCN